MALVHDPAVVGAVARIGTVEAAHCVAQAGGERTFDAAVDEHVVGGHTGLTRVHELAPRDPASGHIEIGALVDDHRALAAELERHRREVLGRSRHHDSTDRSVAGVEDVVPPLLEQRSGLARSALDHRHALGVEVLRQEPGQNRGRAGGDLRRLDCRGVAGGERSDERCEHELDRVVPRPDDQDRAERVPMDPGLGRLLLERRGDPLRAHPLVEVRQRVVDLRAHERDVGDEPFHGRLAEVAAQGVEQVGLALGEHALERMELCLAPLSRPGAAGVVGGAESLDDIGGGFGADRGSPGL